ncbi:MAG: glycosyltransferase family 4 protein [Nitrospira sp.]|jgi:glycosyltransferase involved in cell wall biosynthesis|nr:glycosyltransferase family 4 protein [Nitrospira sp.]
MGPSLRFCMVTTFYPPYSFGGDGMFVYRLSNLLAERGHSVDVIHCRDAYYAQHPAEPAGEWPSHPRITLHSLKSKAGILSPLLTQQLGIPGLKAGKIKRILGEGRFDVIHYHNVSLVGGPKVFEYGRAIKLYTTHEYWLLCPTHVLFKFNQEACAKPSCLTCQLSYRRPPQLWRYTSMLDRALRHLDAVISPSQFASDAHRHMGATVEKTVIPMFIPSQPVNTQPVDSLPMQPMSGERPYFLYVGRLEKLKGLQEVIPFFTQQDRADLWVAGAGQYEAELKRLAQDSPRVKFLGSLPFERLRQLYTGAAAVVVPSLCYETFGQVVAEAFSLKTPVIARDIGALSELVTMSGGGLLYRNSRELGAAIESLRANPARRAELGARGYEAYRQEWTAEQHLDRYLALIDRISRQKGIEHVSPNKI